MFPRDWPPRIRRLDAAYVFETGLTGLPGPAEGPVSGLPLAWPPRLAASTQAALAQRQPLPILRPSGAALPPPLLLTPPPRLPPPPLLLMHPPRLPPPPLLLVPPAPAREPAVEPARSVVFWSTYPSGPDLEALRQPFVPAAAEPESLPLRIRTAGASEHRQGERKKRLRRLQEQVAQASTEADVDALATRAKRARRQAVENHPITLRTEFDWDLIAQADSFQLLGRTQSQLADAGTAWENAEDHANAARQAALKLKLPAAAQAVAGLSGPSGLSISDQVLHLDIKRQMIDGLRTLRSLREKWNVYKNCHHPHLYDRPAAVLRHVLAQCAVHAPRLRQHPIHDFDAELQGMEAAMQRDRLHRPKSRWPVITYDESRLSAPVQARSQARQEAFDASVEAARSDLVSVARQLQAALHGNPSSPTGRVDPEDSFGGALEEVAQGLEQLHLSDRHLDSPPASPHAESPGADELDLELTSLDSPPADADAPYAESEAEGVCPVEPDPLLNDTLDLSHLQRVAALEEGISLLIVDAEHLGTQVRTSREAVAAGPTWKRHANEATAWHRTIQAYERCANQLTRQSRALLGKETREPVVDDLHDRIHTALRAARGQMAQAVTVTLEDFSQVFCEGLMDIMSTRPLGSEEAEDRMARIDELAKHCRTLQAQLGVGALPPQRLKAMGVNPDRYQRPYAALISLCAVLKRPVCRQIDTALDDAALMQDTARIFDKAAKGLDNALADRFISFSGACQSLRGDMVQAAGALQAAEINACHLQILQITPMAIQHINKQCVLLPLVAQGDPLLDGTQASSSVAEGSKAANKPAGGSTSEQAQGFSAELGQLVADADVLCRRTVSLPSDTPTAIRAVQQALLDTLSCAKAAASIAFQFLKNLQEAAELLERAPQARRLEIASSTLGKLSGLVRQSDQLLATPAMQLQKEQCNERADGEHCLRDGVVFFKEMLCTTLSTLNFLKQIWKLQNVAREIFQSECNGRIARASAYDGMTLAYKTCIESIKKCADQWSELANTAQQSNSLDRVNKYSSYKMHADLYHRAIYEQNIVSSKMSILPAKIALDRTVPIEELKASQNALLGMEAVLLDFDKVVRNYAKVSTDYMRFVPLFRVSLALQQESKNLRDQLHIKMVSDVVQDNFKKKIDMQENITSWWQKQLNEPEVKNDVRKTAELRGRIDAFEKDTSMTRKKLKELRGVSSHIGRAKR